MRTNGILPLATKGASIMPSYNNFPIVIYEQLAKGELNEIAKFQVKAKPLGIRGIRGLSWLFHLFPYVTGGKPQFKYQVNYLSQKIEVPFSVLLYRVAYGTETLVDKSADIKDSY